MVQSTRKVRPPRRSERNRGVSVKKRVSVKGDYFRNMKIDLELETKRLVSLISSEGPFINFPVKNNPHLYFGVLKI